MSKWILFGLLTVFQSGIFARTLEPQFVFSGIQVKKDSLKTPAKHSPHKASLYSAFLPGLGQAYNEKYWKIPIVYAGLGISTFYMLKNRDSLRKRQDALNLLSDNDSNTNPAKYYSSIPLASLKAQRAYYRTNRDYSIIAMAAFYIINIIDATVDAHFYKFNIDKPLANRKEKRWDIYSSRVGLTNTVGFAWRF
jgi:hypothetical protein